MLTRCPKCKTLFRTSEADLRKAGGKTRCGKCYTVFLATEAQLEEVKPEPFNTHFPLENAAASDFSPQRAEPDEYAAYDRQHPQDSVGLGAAASSIYNELIIKNRNVLYDIPDSLDDDAPASQNPEIRSNIDIYPQAAQRPLSHNDVSIDEINRRIADLKRRSGGSVPPQAPTTRTETAESWQFQSNPDQQAPVHNDRSFIPEILQDDLYRDVHVASTARANFIIAGTLLGLLGLLFQFILIVRTDLADNLRLRPYIISLCERLKCSVPYKKDTSKLKQQLFTVEIHKTKKVIIDGEKRDVAIVNSRFINKAPFTQPYPVVEIQVLSNKSDLPPVALIRLKPKDYLPKNIDPKQGLEPNAPLELAFEFVLPSKETPSVALKFR